MEKGDRLLHNSVTTVALAINGTSNSKHIVQWASNKFISGGGVMFKLLHVRPRIKMVPSPIGNLPVEQVQDDVASAYKKEEEWKTEVMLRPYKNMCSAKQIETEVVILEAEDVAEAISKEVTENNISMLVIGASSKNAIFRKLWGSNLSSRISECTPSFCTVYVVSREMIDLDTEVNFPFQRPCLPQLQHNLAYASKDYESSNSAHPLLTRNTFLFEDSRVSSSNTSETQYSNSIASLRSYQTDKSWSSNMSFYRSTEYSQSGNEGDIHLELERLRTEINHFMRIHKLAPDESISASQQLNDIHTHHTEEILRLQEIWSRLEKTTRMAQQEKERREAAEKEAEYVKECTEIEVLLGKDVEKSASHEVSEKQSLEKELACSSEPYVKYTWEEIVAATLSFSDALKIGVGASGTVYRGSFHHTVAAIKVLNSNEGYTTRQFKQELEILSRVRHPHVLLLLGACTEKGCLVYEYMENGSLEDRLQCKNNTLPLPWFCRFRIAWEVAFALIFLHNSKPEPIVHRDLKPANILLDNNFVSKIGDAGLSTLFPTLNMPLSTMYKDTDPVGTFFYMDPEYQRTGLVSPKSDTYALGMVILQLLTAKSPMGLALIVETALERDCLMEILDSKAGQWPKAEAKELAILGLCCLEMRRKDRPDLKDQVLPVLERLKAMAEQAYDSALHDPSVPPNHFICPILKVVMDDPCIAADGYTYNRNAIETWLSRNDTSPMTNLLLPTKEIICNNSLLSAIKDWKARTQ
ncbi:hypothetical protein C4D60_Mb05t23060 [Musa balbisiana]|uniref:RING-type E3 ubiquitin transferase n=1 Tax=Musa balbisiana TaxID=52838 RepID=A0A4S8JY85_MUSBA|nr:hypothetical protein C4D60_Mb05t23060 [Musa balbisiana]